MVKRRESVIVILLDLQIVKGEPEAVFLFQQFGDFPFPILTIRIEEKQEMGRISKVRLSIFIENGFFRSIFTKRTIVV